MASHHIIVFEPNHTGHRMQYARWLKDWIEKNGMRFSLATATPTASSDEFRERFVDNAPPDLIDLGARGSVGTWRYQLWVIRALRRVLQANPGSDVLLPEGDKTLGLLWLTGPSLRRVGILVMRAPRADGGASARMKRLLVSMHARKHRLRVLAPALPRGPQYEWRGFPAVPDPVEFRPASDDAFLPEVVANSTRTWVGVFGALNPRKNVVEVVRAVIRGCDPTEVGILLAGKVPQAYAAELDEAVAAARAAGFVVVLEDRFLSDPELDAAIARADVAVVAYSNDAPSGVFGKALAAGTLLVAAGTPALKSAMAPLGSRARYSELNPKALSAAIRAAVSSATATNREPLVLAGPEDFASTLLLTLHR